MKTILNRRKLFSIISMVGGLTGCLLAQTKIKVNQNANPLGNSLIEKPIVLNGSSVIGSGGVITLPDSPNTNTFTLVFRNGLLQAVNLDYKIVDKSITFSFPTLLAADDTFVVVYKV